MKRRCVRGSVAASLGCGVLLAAAGAAKAAATGAAAPRISSVYGTSRAPRHRTLQTANSYATQTELTLCLASEENNAPGSSVTAEELQTAISSVLGLSEDTLIAVSDAVATCQIGDWEGSVSIFNEDSEAQTAGQIAEAHMAAAGDATRDFLSDVAAELSTSNRELRGGDFSLERLGFVVAWTTEDGGVVTTVPTAIASDVSSRSSNSHDDVHRLFGYDVYWPWWLWLLYALLVACIIAPLMYLCMYRTLGTVKAVDNPTLPGEGISPPRVMAHHPRPSYVNMAPNRSLARQQEAQRVAQRKERQERQSIKARAAYEGGGGRNTGTDSDTANNDFAAYVSGVPDDSYVALGASNDNSVGTTGLEGLGLELGGLHPIRGVGRAQGSRASTDLPESHFTGFYSGGDMDDSDNPVSSDNEQYAPRR